jgi:type VI secretion system secreted protein Hcp
VACEPTFAVPVAGGSVDLFLRIAAIRGESVDGQHRDEIDLRSVHDGVAGPGSTRCGAAPKTAGLGSLVVTKSFDLASAGLLRDALTGHTEPKATIVARTRGGAPYNVLGIVLSGVRIQSVRDIVDSGGAAEQVTLGFARIEWTYAAARATGGPDPTRTVHLCWDVAADKAC